MPDSTKVVGQSGCNCVELVLSQGCKLFPLTGLRFRNLAKYYQTRYEGMQVEVEEELQKYKV